MYTAQESTRETRNRGEEKMGVEVVEIKYDFSKGCRVR